MNKGRLECAQWMGEIKPNLTQGKRVYKGQTQKVKAKRQVKARTTEILKARLVCPKYKSDVTLLSVHQPSNSINSGSLSGLLHVFGFLLVFSVFYCL